MEIFVLALSRLVPLAFLVSLTLNGSRYLHDLVLRTRPALAKWAFAAVSLVGLIATAPFAVASTLLRLPPDFVAENCSSGRNIE